METRVEGIAPPIAPALTLQSVDAYSFNFTLRQVEVQSNLSEHQASVAALYADKAERLADQLQWHVQSTAGLDGIVVSSPVPAKNCAAWPRDVWHLRARGSDKEFDWEEYKLNATFEVKDHVTTTSPAMGKLPVRILVFKITGHGGTFHGAALARGVCVSKGQPSNGCHDALQSTFHQFVV